MPGRSVVLLMGFDFDRNVRLLRQVGFNDPLLQRNKIRVRLDLAIDEEERPVGGASNNDLRKSGIVLNRERQNCGRVRLSVSLLIRGKEIKESRDRAGRKNDPKPLAELCSRHGTMRSTRLL